jgi:hypothetical protein
LSGEIAGSVDRRGQIGLGFILALQLSDDVAIGDSFLRIFIMRLLIVLLFDLWASRMLDEWGSLLGNKKATHERE